MVGGHLELETVRGLAVRGAHDPRVVDEHIEPGVRGEELCGGAAYRHEVRQVQFQQFDGGALELVLQHVRRPPGFLKVTAGHDDVRAVVGQCPGGP